MRTITRFAAAVALLVTPASATFWPFRGRATEKASMEKQALITMKQTAIEEQQRIADSICAPEILEEFNARCAHMTGGYMLLWERRAEIDDVYTPGECAPAGCVRPVEGEELTEANAVAAAVEELLKATPKKKTPKLFENRRKKLATTFDKRMRNNVKSLERLLSDWYTLPDSDTIATLLHEGRDAGFVGTALANAHNYILMFNTMRLLLDAPGSGAVKEEALSRLMQGVNDTAEGLPAVRVLSFHALQVLRAAEAEISESNLKMAVQEVNMNAQISLDSCIMSAETCLLNLRSALSEAEIAMPKAQEAASNENIAMGLLEESTLREDELKNALATANDKLQQQCHKTEEQRSRANALLKKVVELQQLAADAREKVEVLEADLVAEKKRYELLMTTMTTTSITIDEGSDDAGCAAGINDSDAETDDVDVDMGVDDNPYDDEEGGNKEDENNGDNKAIESISDDVDDDSDNDFTTVATEG